MELTEAAQRLKRHWLLIVVCVGVIMSIPLVMSSGRADTYVASTRINIGSDASSAAQAEAWADAALAVVTSPSQVAAALDQISVVRDPEHVAENQVGVKSAGVSGVLVLTVTDQDPDVAAALANVLSERFLDDRRAQVIDPIEQNLAQLDAQLRAAEEAIDAIEAETPGNDDVLDTRQLRLTEALTNRSDLRARQQELTTDLLAAQKPSLVDPAMRPSEPEPSRLVTDLVLAGLLGLVVGVTLATVLETLRPTIVGSDALAHVLGAPVLGELSMWKRRRIVGVPDPGGPDVDIGDAPLARHLGLAAGAAGVDVVVIAGVGHSDRLEQLATRLQDGAPQLTVDVVGSYRGDLALHRRCRHEATAGRPRRPMGRRGRSIAHLARRSSSSTNRREASSWSLPRSWHAMSSARSSISSRSLSGRCSASSRFPIQALGGPGRSGDGRIGGGPTRSGRIWQHLRRPT